MTLSFACGPRPFVPEGGRRESLVRSLWPALGNRASTLLLVLSPVRKRREAFLYRLGAPGGGSGPPLRSRVANTGGPKLPPVAPKFVFCVGKILHGVACKGETGCRTSVLRGDGPCAEIGPVADPPL